jgi:UrcA family protein
MSKTALIFAAFLASFGPAAYAQPIETVRSIHVSYADLDLGQAAGRATLEARVGHAVSKLCRMPSGSDLEAMSRYRGCRKSAWSGARPQLAAIYGGARYASRAQTAVATQAQ